MKKMYRLHETYYKHILRIKVHLAWNSIGLRAAVLITFTP